MDMDARKQAFAKRFSALKDKLLATDTEMAPLFGVQRLQITRWRLGMAAPRYSNQRTLERLERLHGLRD
jgi:hypothetical protein